MGKIFKSQKILRWTKKDKIMNALVYFGNALIITALFLAFLYFESDYSTFGEVFSPAYKFVSYFIFSSLILGSAFIYFYIEDKNFLKSAKNSEMFILAIELALIVCFLSGRHLNAIIRPVALVAILLAFLVDRKSALFVQTAFSLLMFLADVLIGKDFFLSCTQLIVAFVAGIISVYVANKDFLRLKLLILSPIISIPAFFSVFVYASYNNFDGFFFSLFLSLLSGPFSICLFMVVLPVFEKVFDKISNFKLAELISHKNKLIKRLITEAPGTFNHSIVVANIAEACAIAIDEDALLTRTCAYYHDVGKLRRPEYFSENQADGNNPHDGLMPELSANIIKSHAQDGYQLAIKHGVPKFIANVCIEHHGTMPILYFYDKAKKYTDAKVDIKEYCYSGVKPQSKITAIIMIADGCEAAARSLKDRSIENVQKVVRKIVNDRLECGQFEECEITIRELNIIIDTIVSNLTGVYHKRVAYPKINLNGIDI